MPARGVRSLRTFLECWRPALTAPSFERFLVLFAGWVVTSGTHAVTEALVMTAVAGLAHHEAFHRFFSRGSWDPDEVGRLLFHKLLPLVPQGRPIPAVIDDTLAPKKGPHVFGIASHIDSVRSTKSRKVFSFGHCWVVLSILVKLPFSSRAWALPVLFRLYRSKKQCAQAGDECRKKTQLAREMVDLLAGWVGERVIHLSGDVAYCCDTLTARLPINVLLTGAMRLDAVLNAPFDPNAKTARGRPRKKGDLLPKPKDLAEDATVPWGTCTADLNGKPKVVQFKTFNGCWLRACGPRLLKIVVVRCVEGTIPFRVFFSMDPTLTVPELLGIYSRRWSIEILFRELKQLFGFADSSARKKAAVLRVAPFVGLCYTTLVLWCSSSADALKLAAPPPRPWYRHKHNLSAADILRAARRVTGHEPLTRSTLKISDLTKPRKQPNTRQRTLEFSP